MSGRHQAPRARWGRLLVAIAATAVVQASSPPALAAVTVQYDFAYRIPRDDFPANGLVVSARQHGYPQDTLPEVQQCGVFALWRVDDNKDLDYWATFWELVEALDKPMPAGDIDDAAWHAGYAVDSTTPRIGAIAVWEPGRGPAGAQGHAAYMAQVASTGRWLFENYNIDPYRYSQFWAGPGDPWWPQHFVHFGTQGPAR